MELVANLLQLFSTNGSLSAFFAEKKAGNYARRNSISRPARGQIFVLDSNGADLAKKP